MNGSEDQRDGGRPEARGAAVRPAGGAVAIVGSLPPPYGGVTIHVDRLTRRLADAGIPYVLYDTRRRRIPERHVVPGRKSLLWFLKFLWTVPEPVVHFHTGRIAALVVAAAVLPWRSRRLLVSLHSEAPMRWYAAAGPLRRAVWHWAVRRAWHIVCVNGRLADWLVGLDVPRERLTVAPAFIAPAEAEADPANLPEDVRRFLEAHSPVIGTHGWFGYFVEGVHVYSFDMILELVRSVRRQFPRAGFYTLISGVYDEAHREAVLAQRRDLGLDDDWLILQGLNHPAALFARSDVFVRPTITDGDSVSVRECLHLGVPVVASDAVPRPEGAVLFRNRDMGALEQAVRSVLADVPGHRRRLCEMVRDDPAERILRVYRRALVTDPC